MKPAVKSQGRRTSSRTCGSIFILLAFLLVSPARCHAQDTATNPLDGYTPTGLAPGAPVGSYPLGGFDTVNPYSGGLNFTLSLLKVGGRGGAGYTIQLPIEQKWTVTHTSSGDGQGHQIDFYDPVFNDFLASTKAGYGPGTLYGRQVGGNFGYCDISGSFLPTKTLTRFTFVTSDGTEYDLRDVQTDGHPNEVGICTFNGISRGKVFKTGDGTSATFISDQPVVDAMFIYSGIVGGSGYLYLKDGTRYRINDGQVSFMIDRNGNRLTFAYNAFGVSSIKDSLNREITIDYGVNEGAPYGLCDRITYKGFGGTTRIIRVSYDSLGNVLRAGYSMQNCRAMFPALNNASTSNPCGGPALVSSVWLPDGSRRYKFLYNSYSELARVELPTGGAFEYDWDGGYVNSPTGGAVCFDCSIYRRVTERRVYSDGVSLESRTTFSKPDTFSGGSVQSSDYTEVNQYDAESRLMQTERHHYFGHAWQSMMPNDPTAYPDWHEGKEYQTETFDAAGTLLRRIANTWDSTAATWLLGPVSNPRIIETDLTLEPNGANLTARQTFSYDQYNNQTEVTEYDYDGSLLRRTHTDYLKTNGVNGASYDTVNPNNTSPDPSATFHLRNLPVQVTIYDGVAARAETTFEYDNYVADGSFHGSLITRSGISQLWDGSCQNCLSGPNFGDPSFTKRGNATAVTRYLLNPGGAQTGSFVSYAQYDVAGNVVKAIDPRSTTARIIATTFSFDDNFGSPDTEAQTNNGATELGAQHSYSLPTFVTNALNQSVHLQYDFHLGRVVNAEDPNGVVSATFFDDLLDRPSKKIVAINGGVDVKSQLLISYDDLNHVITTKTDQTTFEDPYPLKTEVLYDGVGRTIQSRQYENNTQYIEVDQVPFVRLQDPDTNEWTSASQSSNPYRPYLQEQPVWNTKFVDSLGRTIKIRTPDNALVRTAYNGNLVTVTDQALKTRKSVTDAVGRMSDLYESPNDPNYNYRTIYKYDVLDDLLEVTQSDPALQVTQHRSFGYDSLKRLVSASNPESGTINYEYDFAGNLKKRTSGTLVTNYEYDDLNRPLTRTYSDGTPAVTYVYDLPGVPNAKGRLVSASSTISTYSYSSYDALGRVTGATENLGNQTYTLGFGYDLIGHIKRITYPSSHEVDYSYDGAARLTDFSGNLGAGPMRGYATGIIYDAGGRLKKEQFGTDTAIFNKLAYNSRGQLSEIRESTSYSGVNDTTWNRGMIVNDFSQLCSGVGCNAVDNNGNLMKQTISIPDDNQNSTSWYQQYEYDKLNRLTQVNEFDSQAGPLWKQSYNYDGFGNRTIKVIDTSPNIPRTEFAVDAPTNRLLAPGDSLLPADQRKMRYDNFGNLTNDSWSSYGSSNAGVITRTYDAENRLTSALDNTGGTTHYYYDANGHRVRHAISNQPEVWQVYGVGGELLAEYPANGTPSAPQKEYGYRNGQLLITSELGSASQPIPSALTAAPYNGGLNISLSWTGASGATNYRIERASSKDGPYTFAGASATASFIDSGVTNGTAYLYHVCAANGQNACISSYSNIALGVAISFNTDPVIKSFGEDPLNATSAKAAHITELRTAVNAVRTLAGLAAATWTNAIASGAPIKVDDIRDLRTALDPALSAMGIQLGAYTDPVLKGFIEYPLNATTVKAIHIRELRQRVTSGVGEGGGGSGSGFQIHWLVADQLGTPRIVFDQTGTLQGTSRHDYLPFGEELDAGTGGRTTTQGYSATDGVRQQFTLKERDNETGLDFFEARYYGSTQGRFTSADPFNVVLEAQLAAELDPKKARAEFTAYLSQPQQWNRYSYAINNPLLYVDPTGEAIQLSNDPKERERQMQALREAVGSEAAQYLYVNQGTNPDGSANYYVGIYDSGPNGDSRSFEQINEVAGEFGAVIRDTQVLTLELVGRGNVTDDEGNTRYIGRAGNGGDTPAVTGYFKGRLTIKMLDWSKYDIGFLPGRVMSDGQDNMLTPSVMQGHEIGHARARMTGYRDQRGNEESRKASLRLENKIRKLQFPNGPTRKEH